METKPNASRIIKDCGSKHDFKMINEFEHEKRRKISQARGSQGSTVPATIAYEEQGEPPENTRPKEKLQSQLNTIMPMEIVRAQPFFSRHSHLLRD